MSEHLRSVDTFADPARPWIIAFYVVVIAWKLIELGWLIGKDGWPGWKLDLAALGVLLAFCFGLACLLVLVIPR